MRQDNLFEDWLEKVAQVFQDRFHNSKQLFREAQRYLPGGDTRAAVFFRPFPLYVKEGKGCRFEDVDKNLFIDFLNNYTSLVHGHSHPAIVEAVKRQVDKGVSFAAPTRSQNTLAEIICERVKSVEQIRFCNSGTEATMNAIRAARVMTGKTKIAKMEGGYHGSFDLVDVSFDPDIEHAGPPDKPERIRENSGVPDGVLQEVVVIPFNNREATERILREHANELACLIVEPMLGAAGCICQEEDYLKFLRALTRELGILLIFDEVVTFRFSPGGAQEIYAIEPDITAFGKVIGGGLPVGAFGGPKEIMEIYSPRENGSISHSGTFNGNPVTMESGIACLQALTPEMIEYINALGKKIRDGIDASFKKAKIAGQSSGMCSLAWAHFTAGKIRDYRSAAKGNFKAMALVHLNLLLKGINVAARGGEIAISTAMGEEEVALFLEAFEDSLIWVREYIEQTTPELLI